MRAFLIVAAIVLSTVGTARAACDGTAVLFADNFDRLEPSWGEASDAMKIDSGRLIVTPPAGQYYWAASSASVYDDIDMCATVTTIAGVVPEDAKIGLIFWYVDLNNFYVFEIAPNGKASVWRRQRGRWLPQVNWQQAPGATAGDGGVNALRVTTVGAQATFYVNDTKFKELTGSPPDNGQEIGILGASSDKGPASFAIDNLKITKPLSGSPPAAPTPPR